MYKTMVKTVTNSIFMQFQLFGIWIWIGFEQNTFYLYTHSEYCVRCKQMKKVKKNTDHADININFYKMVCQMDTVKILIFFLNFVCNLYVCVCVFFVSSECLNVDHHQSCLLTVVLSMPMPTINNYYSFYNFGSILIYRWFCDRIRNVPSCQNTAAFSWKVNQFVLGWPIPSISVQHNLLMHQYKIDSNTSDPGHKLSAWHFVVVLLWPN